MSLYAKGIVTCLFTSNPISIRSWARAVSYADSNKPGPSNLCISNAAPIILYDNSFSFIFAFLAFFFFGPSRAMTFILSALCVVPLRSFRESSICQNQRQPPLNLLHPHPLLLRILPHLVFFNVSQAKVS